MTYTKVSIPKFTAGAGAPAPKEPNVIFVLAKDVLAMPTKNGVVSTSDLTLKVGATAMAIYINPISIARNDNQDGDGNAETAGWISNFSGTRPGSDEHFDAWKQEHVNEGMLVISKECGETKGTRLQGTPCNPLFFSGVEEQDNNEGKMTTLTLVQGMRTKNKMIHYRGAIPTLAADAIIVDGSGSAGGGV